MKLKIYIRAILSILAFAAAMLWTLPLTGCADDSELLAKEEETILKFLDSKQSEYTVIDGVYRVIESSAFESMINLTDSLLSNQRPTALPVIATGDKVGFIYALYTFTGSGDSGAGALLYTNDPIFIADLENEYSIKDGDADDSNNIREFNSQYWEKGPKLITVGSGEMLRGIDVAIAGCQLGDLVTLIIPSQMAFGKEQIGIIGADKMLLCSLYIASHNDRTPFDYGYIVPPPENEENDEDDQ